MTDIDYLRLSWLSYIDLPQYYVRLIEKGGSIPVAAFADSVLRMDAKGALKCASLNDPARLAARELLASETLITGYINRNDTDGFVAYILRNGDETIVAMRGSESTGMCAPSNIDWADNLCEPFSDSVQRCAIERLNSALPMGKLTYTGHSKGGHNALYALALSDNPEARAIAFNAQGFSENSLSAEGLAALEERGINYVVSGDVVGALLKHPEKRVFVKQTPGTNAHMPEAFTFSDDGRVIRAARTPASFAAEAATRAIDLSVRGNVRAGIQGICHAVIRRAIERNLS